jgi:hypothetical protein
MLLAKIALRTDARASTNQRTLLASDEPFADGAAKVAGFGLHAGVAARADERKKLERLSGGGPAGISQGRPCPRSGCR